SVSEGWPSRRPILAPTVRLSATCSCTQALPEPGKPSSPRASRGTLVLITPSSPGETWRPSVARLSRRCTSCSTGPRPAGVGCCCSWTRPTRF
ncbi:unnamed protein product, partial [Ectocarpus sp. 13 AM-2016]